MSIRKTFTALGAALAACAQLAAFADDVVGVERVDAGTNGLAEVVMPFAPMEGSGPAGFLSGAFEGDGGEFSDTLTALCPAGGVGGGQGPARRDRGEIETGRTNKYHCR